MEGAWQSSTVVLVMPNDQPREQLKSALDLARSGDYAGARRELEELLRTVPDFADGHYYHALACQRLGDSAQARASFERCLEIDPFYHEARDQLRSLSPDTLSGEEARPGQESPTPLFSAPPPPPSPASPPPVIPSFPPIQEPHPEESWRPVLVKPAGFWIRGLALLIDFVLLSMAIVPFSDILLIPFYPYFEDLAGLGREEVAEKILEQALSGDTGPLLMLTVFVLLQQLVTLTFHLLVFGYYHFVSGQTPGKRLLGVRVVDNTSLDYLTLGQSIWRYAASTVSFCLCGVGYFMAAFNPEKRALHDFMASTRVVYSERVPMETAEKTATAVLVLLFVFGVFYSFFLV